MSSKYLDLALDFNLAVLQLKPFKRCRFKEKKDSQRALHCYQTICIFKMFFSSFGIPRSMKSVHVVTPDPHLYLRTVCLPRERATVHIYWEFLGAMAIAFGLTL